MTTTLPTMSQQPKPMFLALMRAEFTRAKAIKKRYWMGEIFATVLSVLGALIPIPVVSIATSIAGAAAKALAKYWLSQAKSGFRRAERARRWDFEHLTLGWPLPSHEVEDLLLEFPSETQAKAKDLKDLVDNDYYSTKGPANTHRLFSNLTESAFWTEHLFATMSKRRYSQFLLAALSLIVTLVGAYLAVSVNSAATFFKVIAAGTTFFVSIDIYGEYSSFARGAKQARDIRQALLAECKASSINHNECLRLFVEYNCMLMEMPLVPDEVYEESKTKLDEAWKRIENSLVTPPA